SPRHSTSIILDTLSQQAMNSVHTDILRREDPLNGDGDHSHDQEPGDHSSSGSQQESTHELQQKAIIEDGEVNTQNALLGPQTVELSGDMKALAREDASLVVANEPVTNVISSKMPHKSFSFMRKLSKKKD
ncbi:hypothetical protein BGZ65_011937, partial [Modicella reniformis]